MHLPWYCQSDHVLTENKHELSGKCVRGGNFGRESGEKATVRLRTFLLKEPSGGKVAAMLKRWQVFKTIFCGEGGSH